MTYDLRGAQSRRPAQGAHRPSSCLERLRSPLLLAPVAIALAACSSAATATSAPILSDTPLPSPVPSEALPTATIACTNRARFLDDLSLPDDSIVQPGAELVKRWLVANEGTCDWGPGYRLVHVGGEGLSASDALALFPARAGSNATWEVILRAPDEPGEYVSEWQAQAPDGTFFGDVVFVVLVVEPGAALPPSP